MGRRFLVAVHYQRQFLVSLNRGICGRPVTTESASTKKSHTPKSGRAKSAPSKTGKTGWRLVRLGAIRISRVSGTTARLRLWNDQEYEGRETLTLTK